MRTRLTERVIMAVLAAALVCLPVHAPAQPVHFKELMTILAIDPPGGWQVLEKPRGSTHKAPVQVSEAEVVFGIGDHKKIEVKIVDGLGGMLGFLGIAQGLEMESSEEYVKPVKIQDLQGIESFKFKDKHGEIKLPVANRFLVTITGSGIDNAEVLREVGDKLDLKKLADLAK